MSLRKLPVKAFERPKGLQWDAPSDALARWAGAPQAAEADDPNTISIYDVIGEDLWSGGGVTSSRIAAALRKIGKNPVTVNINSPGGDFFEGVAILNLLLEHPARVSVKVMGLAASAASVIAMAGDDLTIGVGSFLMIHNAWAVAIGNQHDLRAAADILAPFDAAMAEIYAQRTGMDLGEVKGLMDAETWLSANEAIDKGFADAVVEMPARQAEARADVPAKRRIDAILARHGLPRSERRALLRAVAGTHDAAGTVTPRADDWTAGFDQLIATLSH